MIIIIKWIEDIFKMRKKCNDKITDVSVTLLSNYLIVVNIITKVFRKKPPKKQKQKKIYKNRNKKTTKQFW